jgi:peptidoglycan/LPS O-acetylase OafA/YrhL
VIALYVAYIIPVYLNWRNKRRQRGEYTTPQTAPWNLGRCGKPINGLAIGWTILILVVFSIPPNELVFWTMLLLIAFMALYWMLHAGRHFHGPTREDEKALQAAIMLAETGKNTAKE